MAWPVTRTNNFKPTDTAWNELVNAFQTWGGNVNANSGILSNLAELHGASNVIKLFTSATERLRIDSLGGVTIFGSADLTVGGNVYVSNSGGDSNNTCRMDGFQDTLYLVAASNVGAAVGTQVAFQTATAAGTAASRLTIQSSGGVIFNTMPTAADDGALANGGLRWYAQSNTSLRVRYRGSDGTVREGTITLL